MKAPVQPRYNLKRHARVYQKSGSHTSDIVMNPSDEQIAEWEAQRVFFIFCPGGELRKVSIDWSKGAIRGSHESYYPGQRGTKIRNAVSWFDFSTDLNLLEEIV